MHHRKKTCVQWLPSRCGLGLLRTREISARLHGLSTDGKCVVCVCVVNKFFNVQKWSKWNSTNTNEFCLLPCWMAYWKVNNSMYNLTAVVTCDFWFPWIINLFCCQVKNHCIALCVCVLFSLVCVVCVCVSVCCCCSCLRFLLHIHLHWRRNTSRRCYYCCCTWWWWW